MPDNPPEMHKVAAFYQFLPLPDAAGMIEPYRAFCVGLELRGTMLIAPEGINGTLAGPPEAIDRFVAALQDGRVVAPAFEQL